MRAQDGLLMAELSLALRELQADLAELVVDGVELRLRLVPVFDDDLESVVEGGDLLLGLVGGLLQPGEPGRLFGGDDHRGARGGAPSGQSGEAGSESAGQQGGKGESVPEGERGRARRTAG